MNNVNQLIPIEKTKEIILLGKTNSLFFYLMSYNCNGFKKMKIYKYCSLNTGVEIVRKEQVLLNVPTEFNDPFDSDFYITEEQKKRVNDLVFNYTIFKELDKFVNNDLPRMNKASKILILSLKAQINAYKKLLNINKMYEPVPFLNNFLERFISLNPNLKDDINKKLKQFEENAQCETEKVLRYIKISCFSTKKDSTLMWSHYADKHRGICIEFEEERDVFKPVNYTETKAEFNIEKIYSHVLACHLLGIDNFDGDKIFEKLVFAPFLTKSSEWSYESEIRALAADNVSDVVCDDLMPFLKMNITRILVGVRATGEKLDELINLARTRVIPIVFMKKDDKKFLVVEDPNRKPEISGKKDPKFNVVDKLFLEMNKCLNADLCIPALYVGLTIPGLFAKAIYPELDYKTGYLKVMEETFDKYNREPESEPNDLFIGGQVCYALKESIQKYGTSDIRDSINDLLLILNVERKKNLEIYVDGILQGSGLYRDYKNRIDFNIREFCQHLELYFKELRSKYKESIDKLPSINIKDVDKERNELYELTLINDRLRRIQGFNN